MGVVVLHPPIVRLDQLGPDLRLGEVPVGHPALYAERGLYVRLPGPPALDLVLGYPEGLVDDPGLPRTEDTPAVRVPDERLG